MYEVNVTELRNNLPKYLSSVSQGEEIVVTLHGQAIARLIPPIDKHTEAIKKLKHLRKVCKVGDVVSPIDEQWDVEK